MAVNSRTPCMPRFEIADEPPWYSAGLQLFLPRARRKVFHFGRDRGQRFGLGIANDRREQSAVERHGNADIGMVETQNAVAGPYRIRRRHPLQSERQRADDEIVDRKLESGIAVLVLGRGGVGFLAQRDQPIDGDVRRQIEVRNAFARPGVSRAAMVRRMPSSGTSS